MSPTNHYAYVEDALRVVAPKLSKNAKIFNPTTDAESYKNLPQWSEFKRTVPAAVAQPTNEEDLALLVSRWWLHSLKS
jgi:hypothetical protein